MSRLYEITVRVSGHHPFEVENIKDAVEEEWGLEDEWKEGDEHVFFAGQGSLGGGETEAEFSRRVAQAVWDTVNKFCKVEVQCSYIEDPPTEYYSFDEDDYKCWKKTQ